MSIKGNKVFKKMKTRYQVQFGEERYQCGVFLWHCLSLKNSPQGLQI